MAVQNGVQATNLADILERVLDKGIVIAGDITIALAQVELVSIKIRLVVASVDKAMEMGINWWQQDPFLHSGPTINTIPGSVQNSIPGSIPAEVVQQVPS